MAAEGNRNGDKPLIMVVPYPAQGHIPPAIHLAKRLAAEGFTVALVTVDSIYKNLSKRWNYAEIRLEQVPCDLDISTGVDAASLQDVPKCLELINKVQDPFENLVKSMRPSPCCIITDYFITWAAEITRTSSIPLVTYWPGNAAYSSIHHYSNLLLSNGDVHPGIGKEGKLIDYLPGVDPFRYEDLPDYFRTELFHEIRDVFLASGDRMQHSDCILVNSMTELEPRTFQVMGEALKNYVSVGPLFPLIDHPLGISLKDHDTECLKWLDTQEPQSVLYISFGSISTLTAFAFEELAAGLEASKQPFLWVIRSDLVKSLKEEFIKGFLDRTKRQGLVVSWAPQIQVLASKSVGGFLSHCGWNSVFESICHGVPILGWPCHSEQSINCKLMEEDWKFGKRFSRKIVVERAEAEQIIRDFMSVEVMSDIRFRVAAFKTVAMRTTEDGGVSHTNFQGFVRKMKRNAAE